MKNSKIFAISLILISLSWPTAALDYDDDVSKKVFEKSDKDQDSRLNIDELKNAVKFVVSKTFTSMGVKDPNIITH